MTIGKTNGDILDVAGIGVGPFNLSLAAQLDAIPEVNAAFFEQAPTFDWHPGMMLPGVTLQTSFLKDLVTATNPTSPWSFMAYLVAHKRFYDFLNADFDEIPRQEFARYLAWVARQLPSLRFGTAIREVQADAQGFSLATDQGDVRARNIALGVGLKPNVPAFAQKLTGQDQFHSSASAFHIGRAAGRRVAVVGGGQSGAEIVLHLLNQRGHEAPSHIDWISLRPNFQPLDATPFTNELFTPHYVTSFHDLPEARRRSIVEREKLAGDGVSAPTLAAIYRRLYELRHIEGDGLSLAFLPHREVLDVEQAGKSFRIVMRNGFDGGVAFAAAEMIVWATGYSYRLPDCLAAITHRLSLDATGRLRPSADFSVKWDGPGHHRIFALNAGLISHGIAEPQLSLMAWRSAVIANALAGRNHFDVTPAPSPLAWATAAIPGAARQADRTDA